MFVNLKALVVVLAFAAVIFALAKPLCLRFTAPEDFTRRRAVWFVLTIAAFTTPSYWLYLLVAAPLIGWSARKDSTPLAVYLLFFFVVPPYQIQIPTILIGQLFAMTNDRLLGLVILLPAVWMRIAASRRDGPIRLNGLDFLLLAYGLVQLALFIPYESWTNTLRRGFLFLLDTFLVYFAFSRLLEHKRNLGDAMGALCLSAAIFAPIAIFETTRGWLLYTGISEAWGDPNIFSWLFRGDSLRAQAAAGHSITLGYFFALAIGFWMYLRQSQPSKAINFAFFAMIFAGLFVTYARGPWLTAVLVLVIAIMLGARSAVEMMKVALVPAVITIATLASPFGRRLIELLPYVGSASQDTVDQRQALAETSWRLIQQNPWFGNPFVLLDMEDLRTGDHIIDLVNAYAQVALFYGLVGLALFLAVYLGALRRAYSTWRRSLAAGDADTVWLGASLIACMVSSLFLMAASGHLWLEWVSAGLLTAYGGLRTGQRAESEWVPKGSPVRRPRRTQAI